MENKKYTDLYKANWFITLVITFLFIFEEGIFVVTGYPVFLREGVISMVLYVLAEVLFLLLVVSFILSVLFLCSYFSKGTLIRICSYYFAGLIPAFFFTALWVMLFDNFTYIVLHFSILSIPPYARLIYIVLIFLLGWFSFKKIQSTVKFYVEKRKIRLLPDKPFIALSIVLTIAGLFLISVITRNFLAAGKKVQASGYLPNIIIITADGLDANHMSVYGYQRETTPNLEQIANSSLVAQRAYSNSNKSQGSIISMYTGKTPGFTGVLSSPDILHNTDIFNHIPGLLHQAGYTTYQYGSDYIINPNMANLAYGFDFINSSASYNTLWNALLLAIDGVENPFLQDLVFLLRQDYDRFSTRVNALLTTSNLKSYNLYTRSTSDLDQVRVEKIKSILLEKQGPVFIHLHTFGTHGKYFDINHPKYSINQKNEPEWAVDFYDDSILEFDRLVGDLFDFLEENGLNQNTLLIVTTDHGMNYIAQSPLPLIFHFPGGEFSGVINANTQIVDIYPTIADYLDVAGQIQNPAGIEGQSLLRPIDPDRLIFSFTKVPDEVMVQSIRESRKFNQAPFYQFEAINLIYCDQWFSLKLETAKLESGVFGNMNNPCSEDMVLGGEKATELMLDYLDRADFDISTLVAKLE